MDNSGVHENAVEIKEETLWARSPKDLMTLQQIKVEQELLNDEIFIETFVGAHTTSSLMTTPDNVRREFKQEEVKPEFINYELDLSTLKKEEDELAAGSKDHLKVDAKSILKRKFFCPVCRKYYPSSNSRKNHFLNHFVKGLVVCHCGKLFTKSFLFLRHYFVHFVKTATKTSNNPARKNLRSEDENSHLFENFDNRMEETASNSKISSKPFSSKTDLIRMSRIHSGRKSRTDRDENPYKCKICFKQFSHNGTLTSHSRIHISKKPHKCQICLKQFSVKQNLTVHYRIHTGEKPYKCKICLKQFSQSGQLNSHFRTHTGEKSFQCKICLKQFSQQGNLDLHSRTHTAEKPFQCKICLKQFSQKGSLNLHSRTHTGEKPYKCQICLKQFSQKGSLDSHSRTHTAEKPYQCQICLKQFSVKQNLNVHSRIHMVENYIDA